MQLPLLSFLVSRFYRFNKYIRLRGISQSEIFKQIANRSFYVSLRLHPAKSALMSQFPLKSSKELFFSFSLLFRVFFFDPVQPNG